MTEQLDKTRELIEELSKTNPELAEQLRERCLTAVAEQGATNQKVGEALGSLRSLHTQLDEMLHWERHILKTLGELPAIGGDKSAIEALDLQVGFILIRV